MLKQNKEKKINNNYDIQAVYATGHWIIDDTDAYSSKLLNSTRKRQYWAPISLRVVNSHRH